jgi:N-dimethylarginine dimethylaminohydrolase
VIGNQPDIVVDNSAGGDPDFAADVARLLRDRGLAVEIRTAPRELHFDTGVNLVSAGLAIRLSRVPEPSVLRAIEEDIRQALLHRPSERRRTRSVPVHLADTARVLEWIDIFG